MNDDTIQIRMTNNERLRFVNGLTYAIEHLEALQNTKKTGPARAAHDIITKQLWRLKEMILNGQ